MEQQTLSAYVTARVQAGDGKVAITERLLAVGWSEDAVDKAYAEALISVGVPVPAASTQGAYATRASTLDVILNLFSFILLGIVTTALGSLYFEIVNKYFPDRLDPYSAMMSPDAIHYATAALIIGFPAYVMVVRAWFARYRADETKTESKLTKWITYLVLLAASVTIVGDLITTLYTFLQGEITARFFLKALTILAIAGMIFGFYFLERRKVQYRHAVSRRKFQAFAWVLGGLVLIGIVLGFVAAGSPETGRARTFDQRRASDLSSLASCVGGYAQQYDALPASTANLAQSPSFGYCAQLADPETGAPYEYHIVSPLTDMGSGRKEGSFELCASFSLASTVSVKTAPYYPYSDHPAGRACDTSTVSVRQDVVPAPTAVPVAR